MNNADDLLRAGDLDGARSALVEIVRSSPQDTRARMFLFQLFAVLGEWQKARLQLATLAQLSAEAQMLSVAYGQAMDAEAQRADALEGKIPVIVHGQASAWADDLAQAIGCLARGDITQGEDLRATAFDNAPDTPGHLNDTQFEWIADSDSRFGPTCEAIIAGRWGILPFDQIERIESTGIRDLRDLVWYPVQIAFRSGQSIAAMLPGRYPATERHGQPTEKLARATRWVESSAGEHGVGQHLLSLSGGEEVGLLSLRSLVFD